MDKKQLRKLRDQRDELVTDLETIVSAAAAESRDFTLEEAEKRGNLTARIEGLDDQIRAGEKTIKDARKADKAAQARVGLGLGNLPAGTPGGAIKVNSEHRTYEKGNGASYLQDLCVLSFGAGATGSRYFQALERLQRHAQENHVEALEADAKGSLMSKEQRYFVRQMVEAKTDRKTNYRAGAGIGSMTSYRALSTASGAGGEFVPPMYMTAEWLAFARAGRVVADACHHEELPDGTMSINIPKVTGGTSAATQGTQNTNVSDTDLTTAYVTTPVVTKAGMQIVSLQLIERSPIAFDEAVFKDLGLALAQNIDIAVVNGPGSGDVTGILNTSSINTVTWTQASPTLKGLYGQIGVAKADIANTRFLPATHCFMTPTRWEWISQSVDANSRPLVVPSYNGPFNVAAVSADAATAEGAVGRNFQGLATFEDANVPANLGAGTNQDVVVVSRMDENWLLESPIVTRALPQTYGAQLSVLLQVYEYMAFTAARYPVANAQVTGTGLTPPTFNS